MLISGPGESIRGRTQMLKYTSQMKWYRYFYLVFSTYMDAAEVQFEEALTQTPVTGNISNFIR